VVDDAWLTGTARSVLYRVESERASWQEWHIRSEALRQVRAAALPHHHIDQTVDRIVGIALSPQQAIRIATSRRLPDEPGPLRRIDGTPVYQAAGTTRYTTQRILWAERRLVDTAGRTGGRTADPNSVTLALLQSLANREPLNPGQRLLVHQMATSGRRLQLAIAPAGTGKTTAMRALATAWTASGGTILGLAPSAAAAEQLRHHLTPARDSRTVAADNLAKLIWAINHHEPLADQVGPDTLVIIDEAGMADTLTLDHVVSWCLDQGASIRLVGDDQQLGAIGAGGVLRDIAAEHGALRLDHVVRFTSPAEADASLALRAGDTSALGYYLDHDRIHPVDPDTATATLIDAWLADSHAGRDALILAPTRTLVAQLNATARTARLDGHPPGRETTLADGNRASSGDTVLTRRNNRTLTSGDTAWVRNGDRWRVTAVHPDGSLDVANLRSRAHLTLPADYVATSVELGYATTIHGAQGVTADTCHGLLTGTETRQQLYTMLSRGRHANHAWIQVTTADPHTPPAARDLHEPATATQLLEAVISRDDAPVSATTQLAHADGPARLLGPAVTCYLDAITFAAERHLPSDVKDAIDAAGHLHHLVDADAWPTLRSHLMLIAANGHNPGHILVEAIALGGLQTARDPAAVIDHRLDLTQANDRTRGPLPWLPGIPTQLLDDPDWKTYLSARYVLTRQLADQTRQQASDGQTPRWAAYLPCLDPDLVADIQLWRAAHTIPDSDPRPTGPARHTPAERDTQRRLEHQLTAAHAGIREWTPRILSAAPSLTDDPRLPVLAAQLAALAETRHDTLRLLHAAAGMGDLPDDHPADALGYRITDLTARETARTPRWETIRPTDRPRRPEPPPARRPTDRGISR